MKMYYISGLPYSENELYHHGIPGMKWYLRRFQNPDGSLTPEGRTRYGVGPERDSSRNPRQGDSYKEAPKKKNGMGKRFVTYQLNKIKARHPWMFTDEELGSAMARARDEYNYLQTRTNYRRMKNETNLVRNIASATIGRGAKTTMDILESGAKTIGAKGFEKLTKKWFPDSKITEGDYMAILRNPTAYTEKELNIAKSIFEGKKAYQAYVRDNVQYAREEVSRAREQESLATKLYNEFSSNYKVGQPYGGYTKDEYDRYIQEIKDAREAANGPKKKK